MQKQIAILTAALIATLAFSAAADFDKPVVKRWTKMEKNDKGEISPMAVKVGDRVLFGKYSGQTVKVDGEELLVMKEDDIMAVIEG